MKRLSVTLLLVLALLVSAAFTEGPLREFRPLVVRNLGFAARDLFLWDWQRLLSSALVTHGSWVLVRALVFVSVLVGTLEWRHGSRVAAAAFWGGHLMVLVVLALGISVWHRSVDETVLYATRDVGPSAGYLTCLGVWLGMHLSPRWHYGMAAALMAGLVLLALLPPLFEIAPELDLVADLAHLLAFGIGWSGARLASWRWPGAGESTPG
jgi:hypothetical protein